MQHKQCKQVLDEVHKTKHKVSSNRNLNLYGRAFVTIIVFIRLRRDGSSIGFKFVNTLFYDLNVVLIDPVYSPHIHNSHPNVSLHLKFFTGSLRLFFTLISFIYNLRDCN